jgi:hypothetical protein
MCICVNHLLVNLYTVPIHEMNIQKKSGIGRQIFQIHRGMVGGVVDGAGGVQPRGHQLAAH